MRYKIQFVPIPYGTLAVITEYTGEDLMKSKPVQTWVIPDQDVHGDRLEELVSYLAMLLVESAA
jgi:hypothetical protein